MKTRSKLLAGLLAAFLAFASLACEVEDGFEGDPLEDDTMQDDGFDDGVDDGLDDGVEDDWDDDTDTDTDV